jgi:hypothetical protein
VDHLKEQAAMNYLSRPLERVRTALFGRRAPGKHRRATATPVVPRVVHDQPTPGDWGARLDAARVRRAATPVTAAFEDMGALVRPYLFTPEERQQACRAARLDAWQATR